MSKRLFRIIEYTFFTSLIIGVLFIGFTHWLTRWINEYQKPIENYIALKTQATVDVQKLGVGWQDFFPVIQIQGVALNNDNIDLNIEQVSVGMNLWASLMHFRLQPIFYAHNIKVSYPALFGSTVLPFSLVEGKLIFQEKGDTTQLKIKNLVIENQNISITIQALLSFQKNFENPMIDLSSDFSLQDVAIVKQYMPDPIIKERLRLWLHESVVGADSVTGKFILKGPLNNYPFDDNSGLFLIDSHWKNFTLAFRPDWPAARNMDAHVVFKNRDLSGEISKGFLGDLPLENIHVSLPALGLQTETLDIQGDIQTDTKNARSLVMHSPIGEHLKSLSNIDIQGLAQFLVHVNIPLYPGNDFNAVDGKIIFNNDKFQLKQWWNLTFEQLNGWLTFNQDGILDSSLQALFFKYPTQLHIYGSPTKQTLVDAKGVLGFDGVNKIFPFLSMMQGVMSYQTKLILSPQDSNQFDELNFQSSLQGVAVNLPAPYNKAASVAFPVNLNWRFSTLESFLNLQYGKQMQLNLHFARQQGIHQLKEGKILFTHPSLNGAVSIPSTWQQGLTVHLANLGFESNSNAFAAPVDKSSSNTKNNLLPTDLPPLDITIDNLQYNHQNLGQFILKTEKKNKQYIIDTLALKSPVYQLQTQGIWSSPSTTEMSGLLSSSQIQKAFALWGLPSVIEAQKSQVNFVLSWPGRPWDPLISKMQGTLDLLINHGVITHLDKSSENKIGLGKLVNILSLDTLPRRLSLDFSDLSNKGLSFDTLKGHFVMNQGELKTQDTTLDGPVVYMRMQGMIQLTQETYDLVLKLSPHAGSIPVIAAFAGGPIVGLAALAVNTLVNQGMKKVSMYQYSVKGPWKNPEVKSL